MRKEVGFGLRSSGDGVVRGRRTDETVVGGWRTRLRLVSFAFNERAGRHVEGFAANLERGGDRRCVDDLDYG